ncbi:MAG TPA: hypothetical protein VM689_20650 [Aliidongia sp.]|nr:hypothetical protein [Aliidongia sp.]
MSRADFISMTASAIAGTGGNGAVTLVQVTAPVNVPTFSQAFGSSARMVDYTIIDGVAGKWEKGFGSVAGNVLTRSSIHETYDGATYLSGNPSALAFGSTPTVGNIVIRLAPTSDFALPVPSAIQRTVGSDSFLGYQLSGAIATDNNGSNAALSTGIEYYFPYLNLIRGKIDAVLIGIGSVGAANAGAKLGIYEVGPDGLPGPCITLANALPLTATGPAVDATPASWGVNAGPIRLTPGWFYIGAMVNDATAQLQMFQGISGRALIYPPTGRVNGYGFGTSVRKTAQNSYATGLPTGVPSQTGGTYVLGNMNDGLGMLAVGLRINN